jgi:predicted DNA-binding transcriptional regulator AlpA
MHPHEFKKRMLCTSEAAARCGCSVSTLEKHRLYGGGPTFIRLGRRVVYDPDDLDAWLRSHRRISKSEPRTTDSGQ